MAKKILKAATFGLSGLLIGKKKAKAVEPAATASSTGARPRPIITQLGQGGLGAPPPRPPVQPATILSGKLGS